MLDKKQIRFIQVLCVGTLAACQSGPVQTENLLENTDALDAAFTPGTALTTAQTPGATATPDVTPAAAPEAAPPASTAYADAINLATGAATLGQRAASPDDWDLIVGRWEQAIDKLKQVPGDHPHHATAQTKLKEYGRNLTQAQTQLAKLQRPIAEVPLVKPAAVAAPAAVSSANVPAQPNGTQASGIQASGTQSNGPSARTLKDASIPIVERRGGTPVIEVSINGGRYPMILDTGASHTHITRAMANELGVQVLGQIPVVTASSNQTMVDVGYVESIRVGNIARNNLPVSIGDAVPIGLLGNDVYQDFDVILQVNSVEFRPR